MSGLSGEWRGWYRVTGICEVYVCAFVDLVVCILCAQNSIDLHLSALHSNFASLWLLSLKFLSILFPHFISKFPIPLAPITSIFVHLSFEYIYLLYIFFHSTFHISTYMHVSMYVVF